MSESKKCGNPACSCLLQKGEEFCSPRCEAVKGSTEVLCQCGHPGCRGDALTATA